VVSVNPSSDKEAFPVVSSLTLGRLVRNLLLLAALGFVAVQFAKPLLTVTVTVLVFALVGFLLWLPLHTLVFRRRAPLRQSFDQSRELSRQALAGLRHGCTRLGEWAAVLAPMLLEVASGLVLGGLLVWAYSGQQVEQESLALGAAAGAVCGVLVVAARRRPTGVEEVIAVSHAEREP
jgi:hypothetical protein